MRALAAGILVTLLVARATCLSNKTVVTPASSRLLTFGILLAHAPPAGNLLASLVACAL